MEYFKDLPDPSRRILHRSVVLLVNMALKLICLCLISAALAAPSPQSPTHGLGGHGTEAPLGTGKMADMLASTFAGVTAPLPLYKMTKAEKPEFNVPGVIREQLYYGPLVLKPAAVSSSSWTVTEGSRYIMGNRRKRKKKRV
jgi:hypothetical protein